MDLKTLPSRVTSLDVIPARYRIAYFDDERRGDFYLDMRIARVVSEGDSEIARLNNEIAKIARERAALEATQRYGAASRALVDEVLQAGINPKMANAVAALISETVEFEAEDTDSSEIVLARTSVGVKSLGALVGDFLMSDEGAAFRSKADATGSNYFASLVAEIKCAR